jgi:DNA-binding beta-propeller fold protein YncE
MRLPAALLFLLLTPSLRPVPARAQPEFLLEWGASGSTFFAPRFAAVDENGDVYVSDLLLVQKFDETGTYLTRIGAGGTGDGEFQNPNGLAADGLGLLYTTEHGGNNRVQWFSTANVYLGQWGTFGEGDGQFRSPQGIAVVPGELVYVADRANHRIQKFDPAGAFLGKWGAAGEAAGQFRFPTGVAVDAQGNVWVSDSENHRIQKFDADGGFLSAFGGPGSGDGELSFPRGLAISAGGTLYVADEGNHRIQEFSSGGEFLARWGANGGDGTPGSLPGEFHGPSGVALDESRGYVYVVDTGNNRVQKFARPAPVDEESWGRIKTRFRSP